LPVSSVTVNPADGAGNVTFDARGVSFLNASGKAWNPAAYSGLSVYLENYLPNIGVELLQLFG